MIHSAHFLGREGVMNKDLVHVSNSDLCANLKSLVKKEKELLAEILVHLQEVAKRKIYLDLGYSSLFEYMTLDLGYSAASAMRRIEAAKLLSHSPNTLEQIKTGEINLSHISLLAQSVREAERTHKEKIDPEKRTVLLNSIANKPKEEAEVILCRQLAIPVINTIRTKRQADESVKVQITFSQNEWKQIEEVRELLSHETSGDLKDVILLLAKKVRSSKRNIQKSTDSSIEKKSRELEEDFCHEQHSPSTSAAEINDINLRGRKTIPVAIKEELFKKQKHCQYISKITNRKCESRWQLEIDHIQPVWAGGTNDITNLQILCSQHNKHRFRKQITKRNVVPNSS